MFPAAAYVIRTATDLDEADVVRIAALDSRQRPSGRILIGELNGAPAAALGLDDGRLVADPFQRTDRLAFYLRLRATGINAFERTPSVATRMRAALPAAATLRRQTA